MNALDLRELKQVIGDMRFMQAAALVASGLNDSKDASQYMKKLARLEKSIDAEITNFSTTTTKEQYK